MRDPIAERRLTFRATGSEVEQSVTVRIGRPRPSQGDASFEIDYEIQGPGEHQHSSKIAGADSMQTLTDVFIVLNGLLDSVRREGTLTWEGSVGATRFPTY
jgi:hypothetical protein